MIHSALSPYGVSSIFYGAGYSSASAKKLGIANSLDIQKDSHPLIYKHHCEQNAHEHYLNNEESALHCVQYTNPYIWDDPSRLRAPMCKGQQEYEEEARQFGMNVGVTLPLRFKQTGFGGIGLCTNELDGIEFTAQWREYQQHIIATCFIFDEMYRADFSHEIAQLTPREKDTLLYVSAGHTLQSIAYILNIKETTLRSHMANIRKNSMQEIMPKL